MNNRFQVGLVFVVCMVSAAPAFAWNPLLRKNPDVESGNQSLQNKKYEEALRDYQSASEKHPKEPGLMLNRGLAALGAQQGDRAKQEFQEAATRATNVEVKSKAYYNLGTALLNEAQPLPPEQRQPILKQSIDALKKSLRAKPSNPDAAWNLALANQEFQKAVEQQKQNEQQQKQDKQDQKNDQSQPPQDPSQEKSESDSKSKSDQADQTKEDKQKQDSNASKDGDKEQEQDIKPSPQPQNTSEATKTFEEQKALLDALERQEKSLPAQLMQRRSMRRQKPDKDW